MYTVLGRQQTSSHVKGSVASQVAQGMTKDLVEIGVVGTSTYMCVGIFALNLKS